jgi:hypothetical protein
LPSIGSVYDVERYELRQGATVLFFRHPLPLDAAFEDVFGRMAAAGWSFSDERGAGNVRTFSACPTDCEQQRLYVIMKEDRTGHVIAVVRWPGATEARRGLRLPGACVPIGLTEAGGWMPVLDVDLDRDGRLDLFVPRRANPPDPSEDGEVQPRAEVVWDAYVMRGDCGYAVGSFGAVPPSDHASEPGRRGLIDLAVPDRTTVDGVQQWVAEVWWFDGSKYAPKRRRGRALR